MTYSFLALSVGEMADYAWASIVARVLKCYDQRFSSAFQNLKFLLFQNLTKRWVLYLQSSKADLNYRSLTLWIVKFQFDHF